MAQSLLGKILVFMCPQTSMVEPFFHCPLPLLGCEKRACKGLLCHRGHFSFNPCLTRNSLGLLDLLSLRCLATMAWSWILILPWKSIASKLWRILRTRQFMIFEVQSQFN
eukprot:c37496_g1_i1 orf=1-327(-)